MINFLPSHIRNTNLRLHAWRSLITRNNHRKTRVRVENIKTFSNALQPRKSWWVLFTPQSFKRGVYCENRFGNFYFFFPRLFALTGDKMIRHVGHRCRYWGWEIFFFSVFNIEQRRIRRTLSGELFTRIQSYGTRVCVCAYTRRIRRIFFFFFWGSRKFRKKLLGDRIQKTKKKKRVQFAWAILAVNYRKPTRFTGSTYRIVHKNILHKRLEIWCFHVGIRRIENARANCEWIYV